MKKMKLSSLKQFGLKIIKDSDFENLGYLNKKSSKMLVYLNDNKYLSELNLKNISTIITTNEIAHKIPKKYGIAITKKPDFVFLKIHNFLANQGFYPVVSNKIGKNNKIDPDIKLPNNIQIGKNNIIEANVIIYPNTIIGNNVIVRSGTIIGSSGFEYKRFQNKIIEITHAGGVIIEDNVEIKANCCIDRALFGNYTKIGKYTKIDKGVNISHEVSIGRRCLIASSAIINGSTSVGDDVYIGPGAIISNGLRINKNAFVSLGAVVVKDISKYEKVTGNFAISHEKFLANLIKNNIY